MAALEILGALAALVLLSGVVWGRLDRLALLRRASELSPYSIAEIDGGNGLIPARNGTLRPFGRIVLLDIRDPDHPLLHTRDGRIELPPMRPGHWWIYWASRVTIFGFVEDNIRFHVPVAVQHLLPERLRYRWPWRRRPVFKRRRYL